MDFENNVIDINSARVNSTRAKRAIVPLGTQAAVLPTYIPKPQKEVGRIVEIGNDYASIPVDTTIWQEYSEIFNSIVMNDSKFDENSDYNGEKEVQCIDLLTRLEDSASFQLSLIKLFEPITLNKYIELEEMRNSLISSLSDYIHYKANENKGIKIGMYAGIAISYDRRIAYERETITEFFAMIDAQTIIKAHYRTGVGHHRDYLPDVKRMLRDIKIKIMPRQSNTSEAPAEGNEMAALKSEE